MGGFMLANLLAALAADYAALLAARLLLALSAATFMPAASGYAARLGGAQRHGRALSMITDRLTLAIVVGVRLGVLVSEGFGRRATFLGMAGPAALSQLGILACSHASRLPLTERMIWPLALTCGVPTLALLLARLL
jgi:DHA1 family inner membrane transport protein